MNKVQQPYPAKVHVETLVVTVMLASGAAEEVIAAVDGGRLEQLRGQKRPHCDDMSAQQERWQGYGQGVGEDVLDGVSVLRGKSHGGREPVVDFVDAGVERAPVEQPVGVVEEDLADEDADGKVPDETARGREAGGDLESGRQPLAHGMIDETELHGEQHGLVSQRDDGGMADLSSGGLLGRGLDLVLLGKGWPDVV